MPEPEVDLSMLLAFRIVADEFLTPSKKTKDNTTIFRLFSGHQELVYLSEKMFLNNSEVSMKYFLPIKKKLIFVGGLICKISKYITADYPPFITLVVPLCPTAVREKLF